MLDFHSHILPHIDDGSADVEESLQLLTMLRQQGVDLVCATPHFDATHRTPQRFLEKRESSYQTLEGHLTDAHPEIRLGAEVAYYEGISRMRELPELRLQGTNLLLLEMPMGPWSHYAAKELSDLSCSGEITVVLAHVERYLADQKGNTVEKLLEKGILLQCNASFFAERRTARKALKMLKAGQIHFLGSDCHGIKSRPPRLDEAYGVITKKFGHGILDELDSFEAHLLRERRVGRFS